MVVVECSVPQCDFKTNDVSEALAVALLSNHGLAHQNTVPAVSTQPAPTFQGPKHERPKIDVGVSTEDWNVFVRRCAKRTRRQPPPPPRPKWIKRRRQHAQTASTPLKYLQREPVGGTPNLTNCASIATELAAGKNANPACPMTISPASRP
jgi:hypothetical protein